jgi:hypothetical protein
MSMTTHIDEVRLEGIHGTFVLRQPARGVVIVTFSGHDAGEFGDAPFHHLERQLDGSDRVELFIDARYGRAASIDVSNDWAQWLGRHRDKFRHVSMLTGSRFIQLSADFVRRFAELGPLMRIYTDPASFDGALGSSVASAAYA